MKHNRGTRLLPEVRRDMIMRASVIVVREYGFAQLSMDRVSHHCGVVTTVKTIQHYFRNREFLYVAVVRYARINTLSDVIDAAEEYERARMRGRRA